jgi:hypothetical protein
LSPPAFVRDDCPSLSPPRSSSTAIPSQSRGPTWQSFPRSYIVPTQRIIQLYKTVRVQQSQKQTDRERGQNLYLRVLPSATSLRPSLTPRTMNYYANLFVSTFFKPPSLVESDRVPRQDANHLVLSLSPPSKSIVAKTSSPSRPTSHVDHNRQPLNNPPASSLWWYNATNSRPGLSRTQCSRP